MAGFFQQLLGSAAKGFFTNDYLRDYTHASKTFLTNGYGYAPKYKFLFHVYFDTNDSEITALQEPNMPSDRNYGLAVKSVQLPKYTFDTHSLNQYNRKRLIQTKIKYDPIQIEFHDDNNNLINKLWYAYYTYYYKDATQSDPIGSTSTIKMGDRRKTSDINSRNIYNKSISQDSDWGYIGEVDASETYRKVPFFRAINIYGFNQHNFILYRLINPIIQSFSHDQYSYSATSEMMTNTMQIEYETVKYFTGAVDGKNPSQVVPKFGEEAHYDKRVSPLAAPGSNSSIMGQGGLIASAGGIVEDIQNGNILGAIRGINNTAKQFKNPQTLINSVKSEALGAGAAWLTGTANRNNLFNFPSQNSTQGMVDTVNKGIVAGFEKTSDYVRNSSLGGNSSPSSPNYENQMDRASDKAYSPTINPGSSVQLGPFSPAINSMSRTEINQGISNMITPETRKLTPEQVNQRLGFGGK